MIGIVGARGVGKTTLMLQHIKQNLDERKAVYVNADDTYFSENSLLDFADSFAKTGGKYLFIDEIHKYPQWSKELKLIYDYLPDLQVVFSGSSILDIYKGSDDLSRRALSYFMPGMSFREYLNMSQNLTIAPYSLADILANKVETDVKYPLQLFKNYLECGYYPFYADEEFSVRLQNVINQTLENDIPMFVNMNAATSRKLKQLLYIVAQNVPFKPNFNGLAAAMDINRNQVKDYLVYMEKASLITMLQRKTTGVAAMNKTEKVYLNNTNLIVALAKENANIGNFRETFFMSQVSVDNTVVSAERADFTINNFTFEIGGKSKRQKQIQRLLTRP
ncbi:MAG: AAA family ATPase [Lentimicrobiaceae bacterium]|jgi:predicted AAA+ superfamily ATPase|nr:AAA family ATPase [Lentimicrobiaceae bacterium]